MDITLIYLFGSIALAVIWIITQTRHLWLLFLPGALLIILGISLINEGVSIKTGFNETVNTLTNTTTQTDLFTQTKNNDTKIFGWWMLGLGLILLSSPMMLGIND